MKKLLLLLLALLLCTAASAEELIVEEEELPTGVFSPLPMDMSPGHVADEACYSEDRYEDDSITVEMRKEWIDDVHLNIAHVTIRDASQLRTGLAHPKARLNNYVYAIARDCNAIVATGGDFFTNDEGGYVVRMNQVFRTSPKASHDLLIIDQNADFHIIPKCDPAALKALKEGGTEFVNVFWFGPALVIDGEKQDMPEKYQYNIRRKEPRTAIGQIGPLEYLMVCADGRNTDSAGCTVETLAQFMYDQGCVQAYNLDGGNSASMAFHGETYVTKVGRDRPLSDIIYFATAIDFGLDGEAAQ